MAKATTTSNNGIIEGVSNIIHAFFVLTRLIKSQTIKLEKITDISTDAVLHSVQYIDVTTRQNLDAAKAKSLVWSQALYP